MKKYFYIELKKDTFISRLKIILLYRDIKVLFFMRYKLTIFTCDIDLSFLNAIQIYRYKSRWNPFNIQKKIKINEKKKIYENDYSDILTILKNI